MRRSKMLKVITFFPGSLVCLVILFISGCSTTAQKTQSNLVTPNLPVSVQPVAPVQPSLPQIEKKAILPVRQDMELIRNAITINRNGDKDIIVVYKLKGDADATGVKVVNISQGRPKIIYQRTFGTSYVKLLSSKNGPLIIVLYPSRDRVKNTTTYRWDGKDFIILKGKTQAL